MMTKFKIALSAALVLGTASAALAAGKHVVRHERTVQERVEPGYYSYGYYPAQPRGEETYIWVQDQGFRESNGE